MPVAAFAHDALLKLFRIYCLIGGMPEIVATYASHKELLARQYSALRGLAFWVREKSTSIAEVDYLFSYKEKLVPVEVKSGATGTLRSLLVFMDLAPHNIAVRFYAGEILISTITTPDGKTVHLLNLPYYLVSQIEKYLEWFERQLPA